MSRLKIERSYDYGSGGDGYVRVPNFIARGGASKRALSGIQVGVLVYLLSHSEGYDVTAESIARDLNNGRDAIRTALRELQNAGYVEHDKNRGPDGLWQHVMTVRDMPVSAAQVQERETSAWKSGAGGSGPLQKTNLKKTKKKSAGSSAKSNFGASEPTDIELDDLRELLEDINEGDLDARWFWHFLVDEFNAKFPVDWARARADAGQLVGIVRNRVAVNEPIDVLPPRADRQNRIAS